VIDEKKEEEANRKVWKVWGEKKKKKRKKEKLGHRC